MSVGIDIQLDYAADDSCQLRLWARGHHAADVFLNACEHALFVWDERQVQLTGRPTRQEFWRTVKADADTRARGVCDTLHVPSKQGRGAYAVTVLEPWLPLHGQTP